MKPQKYRKQPIEIEAMQFTDGVSQAVLMEWTGTRIGEHGDEFLVFVPLAWPKPKLWVEANQCYVPIERGEWIIRDELGFYPCKPEVFAKTYRLVEQ